MVTLTLAFRDMILHSTFSVVYGDLNFAPGVQAIQERKVLGDYGPDVDAIRHSRRSGDVHTDRFAVHAI